MAISITNARALQTIVASRQPIVVDGMIGSKSLAAIKRLSEVDRFVVLGASRMMRIVLPTIKPAITVSINTARGVAELVSDRTGVPLDFLMLTLELENFKSADGTGYSVEFEGTFRGLGQFDKATWDAVMPNVSFERVCDTSLSLTAIATLYLSNKATFVRQGNNPLLYSIGIAYLYHNQGAGSANLFLRTGMLVFPDQSRAAVDLFFKTRIDYDRADPRGISIANGESIIPGFPRV
jgi:hypothetical protein